MTARPAGLGVSTDRAFAAALRGRPCEVVGLDDGWEGSPTRSLPVHRWVGDADHSDTLLLDHCQGPVLDVGCGPGRMAEHLFDRGVGVLGLDIVPAAVRLARRRGVAAVVADVFSDVPAEGSWGSVLLADGNIGIGGDPVRLLSRVRDLLAPGGTVVVDLAEPGAGLVVRTVHLRVGRMRSPEFSWALVAPEVVADVAAKADLTVQRTHDVGGRCFAVLTAPPGAGREFGRSS